MLRVAHVDPVTTRVLAPNASPMTLDGTNTFLVGAPGSGALICIDPGPGDPEHREAIEAVARERDAEVVEVVLTHHHVDHAEGAVFGRHWDVPVRCAKPQLVDGSTGAVTDGEVLDAGGVDLRVIATPGHSSDHLCLHVTATDSVISGDHVLGRGTSVVAWPDGDVRSYVTSLARLAEVGARVLHPGHGSTIERPAAVILDYITHRKEREATILDIVTRGARSVDEIVAEIYGPLGGTLTAAAALTVKAHLDALRREGRITWPELAAEQEALDV